MGRLSTVPVMSVRCATELAVSVCIRFVISSCTGEMREKYLATTEAQTQDLCSYGACFK